jgi:hypothetical protein
VQTEFVTLGRVTSAAIDVHGSFGPNAGPIGFAAGDGDGTGAGCARALAGKNAPASTSAAVASKKRFTSALAFAVRFRQSPGRKVRPIGGWRVPRAGRTIGAMHPIVLEISLLLLSAIAFWLLDRYVIGCLKV